jgi:hypothetical protein
MDFYIRSNDDNDKDYMAKYEEYQSHLRKFNLNEHKDLWAFFATDFFHDGIMEAFQFSQDMKRLSFRISCPNIKVNRGDSWKYINPIWFTCRFEEIVSIQMEILKKDECNDPLAVTEKNVKYLESEINTLAGQIEKYNIMYQDEYQEEFQSIIIKTLPCQRNISLIFRSLSVEPDEALAFELMKGNSAFEIPLFDHLK